MGQRVEKPAIAQDSGEGVDDLEILHPDRSAIIAGVKVTVREYGFVEGLRLRPIMASFLDDLHKSIESGRLPELEEVVTLLGVHTDAVMNAVCISADVDITWLEALSQEDGEHLLMLWWAANGPFYIRSVFQRIAASRAAASQRAGETSTQP